MDYFLKSADESALHAALVAAGVLIAAQVPVIDVIDGVPTQAGMQDGHALAGGVALDVIGTIYKPTGGVLTVDGMEVPEMAPIPGYHANLRGDLSDEQRAALAGLLIDPPAQPYRVFG